ncbi:hypothetical protein G8C93_00140 [Cellulosimicrobium cellulans]|uniref:hypothetical protein n=1 Tax=Cellulosimicrobium cellulans TaxID=1710 RepID=UPI0018843E69|nr:hypothetical protein [Cellulosimicrobium cellulans]MBE9924303.1 hypothetical protein [Cellulosimicrobium cellulans]
MPLPLDDPDFELLWPLDVFRDELDAVLANRSAQATKHLLREAFASPRLAELVEKGEQFEDEYLVPTDVLGPARELRQRISEVREQKPPKPYYNQRSLPPLAPPRVSRVQLAGDAFARLVKEMDEAGYFDKGLGPDCVDAHRAPPSLLLEERLGVPDLWPLWSGEWSGELFYSLIEVFHDLVARPRVVERYHDFSGCGEHYGQYAVKPGRALYVARVNSILERNGFSVRLAPDGEDAGRVVVATDDARDDLLERSIAADDADSKDVRYAIRLFRSREATRAEKRSAVVSLAGVLENERNLLKQEFLSGDEGALFTIANKFAIRHQRADQRPDYDDAYLDWIFWWYLATVELVRSLRQREAAQ